MAILKVLVMKNGKQILTQKILSMNIKTNIVTNMNINTNITNINIRLEELSISNI